MATTTIGPRTIAEALGIPAALLLVLALAALVVVSIPDQRPTVPLCQEDEVITGVGDYRGDTAGWEEYDCTNVDELVEHGPPHVHLGEVTRYCVAGTAITVLEAGKRAGGRC